MRILRNDALGLFLSHVWEDRERVAITPNCPTVPVFCVGVLLHLVTFLLAAADLSMASLTGLD